MCMRRITVLLFDHVVMALGFITLTLFPHYVKVYGLSQEVLGWGMVAFMAGLSLAFILASILPFRASEILTTSYLLLALTCLILPMIRDASIVLALRFIQGASITSIPVLTMHVNKLYQGRIGFIASSVVLAGIFTGSYLGATILSMMTVDVAYRLLAILVAALALYWYSVYNRDFTRQEIINLRGIWLDIFEWTWGTSFHVLLGILYGFLGLVDYLRQQGFIDVGLGVEAYSLSAIAWTIIAGFYGYMLVSRVRGGVVRTSINSMTVIYVLTLTGLVLVLFTAQPTSNIGLILIASTQAAGVPFWTLVGQLYSNYSGKVFATGFIANLGTLTGSLIMKLASTQECLRITLIVYLLLGLASTIASYIIAKKFLQEK